ncbi:MAG: tRNA uridine-5-carboxymethylaminomethyl(34) synthesis GTPase MnmE [Eubacterium sp.]|nr:tRNA uridine-5-carboxymethylaminomethyl(34) synthesis GTPase MnmE [Eubacterium sp.]
MSDTIAAIATGNSVAGIGVIRISGDTAISVADSVFKALDGTSLAEIKGYTAKFGNVYDQNTSFDNAIALVFRNPKSYTGEDVVELSVHGGIFIVEKTLEAVFNAGARPAEPGEFTKRAFLNGKMDLAQAEAVATLITAQGQEAAKASFNLLQGSLSKKISIVLDKLIDCSALMAAWVDYPDEEIPELEEDTLLTTLQDTENDLISLIKNYENGSAMTEGVDTAIVGKPNAGKSTLMNMLSGKEKSIVTHIKGTTRDIVENSVRLDNIILHLSDTAGIHESDDIVESIGIQKAIEKIDTASLVLAVFDGAELLSAEDEMLIDNCKNKPCIAIINKTDLEQKIEIEKIKSNFEHIVFISAKNSDDAGQLSKEVKKLLGVENLDTSQPILASKRQKLCVQNALTCITEAREGAEIGITYDAINVMIDSAIDELLTLTGKKATEEVVNNIFANFCVGK